MHESQEGYRRRWRQSNSLTMMILMIKSRQAVVNPGRVMTGQGKNDLSREQSSRDMEVAREKAFQGKDKDVIQVTR